MFVHIYILDVFTEKPYSKSLERTCNIVYIPVTTSSNAMSMMPNKHGSLQLDGLSRCSAVRKNTVCKYFTASILVLVKIFRQDFD